MLLPRWPLIPHLGLSLCALVAACAEAGAPEDAPFELGVGAEDPEAGKPLVARALPSESKEDSVIGRKGPAVAWDNGAAQVWAVRNVWADSRSAEARQAGLAWVADSGLTWDQKYAAWVQSMPSAQSADGRATFAVTTPWGKTVPSPALECAEVAMFLRATFASWYGLPFYLEGTIGGKRIYVGHFGFLQEDGTRYPGTPAFKTAYRDHTALGARWTRDGWPQDAKLRARSLGGSQDDYQPALFEGARAGAYFDELYLNKRTGYYLLLLLSYFGSVNLADPSNTFNLDPAAIRAGDPLVQRWQRSGIGHVYVVKLVERLADGKVAAEVVSGSMPRRQPVRESAASSQSAFLSTYAGGPGQNTEGQAYAALGGGLKRWRTPIAASGRYTHAVPEADRAAFIDASNLTALAARTETFRGLLGTLSPTQQRDTLLQQIAAQRAHLRRYPASCAARTRREDAFTRLYELLRRDFGQDRDAVDAAYRRLEDYVFAELVYGESRTCCWNSTTSAMFEIALDKAESDEGEAGKDCVEPVVFRATAGAYEPFRQHAALIGREAEWKAWTADEACPQAASAADDRLARSAATPWCRVRERVEDAGATPVPGADVHEPNDADRDARRAGVGTLEGRIAAGDEDWFAFEAQAAGALTVSAAFRHASGDVELAVVGADGATLGASTGSTDSEQVVVRVAAGRVLVRVHIYGQAASAQGYQLTLAFAAAAAGSATPDSHEPDNTPSQAATLAPGATLDVTSCGDLDHFAVTTARPGQLTGSIAFRHAEGDLDLVLLDQSGQVVVSSDSASDGETVTVLVGVGRYVLKVKRYGSGASCQTYRISASLR
jgi:hypothetical protein